MRQKMSFGELPKEKGYLNEGEVLQIPLANRSACNNEQEGSGSKGIRAYQRLEVKTCPVCGARCFSDMDTCYNCLHSFVHVEAKPEGLPCVEMDGLRLRHMIRSAGPRWILSPREGRKVLPNCGIVKTDRSRCQAKLVELSPLNARRV